MKRKFVILDRDGTIITERNYLSHHNQVELISNAAIGLKKLRELGFGLLVVTNQAGVGRGYFNLDDLKLIHKRMLDLLAAEGVILDGIYFCPHKAEDNCHCRKPKLGLIEQALKDHDFNPQESFVIGDKAIDIELGQKMGATTFLVRTGYGTMVEKENIVNPDFVVDDLYSAVNTILKTHTNDELYSHG
ncbi:MAG: HAD family hydrolase [Candidatus Levyibacteriota bacterium]|nr:MAG: HAD family hydrolase [Candidatus Levybacteria bacterium]